MITICSGIIHGEPYVVSHCCLLCWSLLRTGVNAAPVAELGGRLLPPAHTCPCRSRPCAAAIQFLNLQVPVSTHHSILC